jgi:hypothetical protein
MQWGQAITRKVGAAVLSALLLSTIVLVGPSETALAAKPQAPLTKDNPRTDLPRVLDGEVLAVHEAGVRAYVGGNFTTVEIDGIAQNIPHFFALDLTTGALLGGFSHDVSGEVRAIELSPDGADLYLGGTFKNVNGVSRRGIVKLDACSLSRCPKSMPPSSSSETRRLSMRGTSPSETGSSAAG